MKRREFIKAAAATIGSMAAPSLAAKAAAARPVLVDVGPVQVLPDDVERTWLGESFWANRLQDWRLTSGRFESMRGESSFEARTVSLITRFLADGHAPGRVSAKVGLRDSDKQGFCGFLLGVGRGELDYRGCALVHSRAGTNGGFMAVIDHDGELSFRDFSSQDAPLAFEKLDRTGSGDAGPVGRRSINLDCHIDPVADGRFDVRLVAGDAKSGEELGFVVRTGVSAAELRGGISLIASSPPHEAGARWWISDLATGGDKISEHPERAFGPVMGCMHSVNKRVLKLTAQYMPISDVEQNRARLDYRRRGSRKWRKGPVADIGDGFMAAFRLDNWNYTWDHEYRIVNPDGENTPQFEGQVVKDPDDERELRIALYSCIIPVSKSLDDA